MDNSDDFHVIYHFQLQTTSRTEIQAEVKGLEEL